MEKKRFFHEPGTLKEIIEGKSVIESKRDEGLARKIAGITVNEAVIITENIIPEEFLDARRPSKKFYTYGSEARLSIPYSKREAIEQKTMPQKAIREALSNLENKAYSGFTWLSLLDERTHNKAFFDYVLEGAKLYAYSRLFEPVKISHVFETKGKAELGANFYAAVPSTEKKGGYKFYLHDVPYNEHPDMHHLWTAIKGTCGCDYKQHYLNNFRHTLRNGKASKRVENLFCMHEIAAYIAVASDCMKRENRLPSLMMPFPIPSEELVSYWNKLKRNVAIKRKRCREALNNAERSILLGDFIRAFGYDASFVDYASNREKPKKLWLYGW